MPTELTENETLVHHAVVDLYEVYDLDAVTAVHVSKLLGMPWSVVNDAFVSLATKGVMDTQYGTDNLVVRCDNNGYFPLSNNKE